MMQTLTHLLKVKGYAPVAADYTLTHLLKVKGYAPVAADYTLTHLLKVKGYAPVAADYFTVYNLATEETQSIFKVSQSPAFPLLIAEIGLQKTKWKVCLNHFYVQWCIICTNHNADSSLATLVVHHLYQPQC